MQLETGVMVGNGEDDDDDDDNGAGTYSGMLQQSRGLEYED